MVDSCICDMMNVPAVLTFPENNIPGAALAEFMESIIL